MRAGVIHDSDSSDCSTTACELLPDRPEAAVILRCTQSTAELDMVKSCVGPESRLRCLEVPVLSGGYSTSEVALARGQRA